MVFGRLTRRNGGKTMNYVTGAMIRILREKNNMTQRQLAEKLNVSDKTTSKEPLPLVFCLCHFRNLSDGKVLSGAKC